jgi:hypothetical protein
LERIRIWIVRSGRPAHPQPPFPVGRGFEILQIEKGRLPSAFHFFIGNSLFICWIFLWILRDLNPRPSDYESDALTN